MSKVRPSVQNLLPLFPPHLEISPLSHVLNSEYIIRDYLQTRLVILPHRLDSARHIQAGEFSPWRTIHERTSTTDRGRRGGTQENPFPTNVQFSCWRLVERIERGYPFPANRPGPQLVLPRSVFLSSLNEPSVVDRSTRNLCEKSSLLSDRLDSKEWSVNYFGYEAALIIYRRFWQRFYTRLLRSLNK